MTSEEIEQTLQLVVRNQNRLSEAQIRFGERQAQLDEVIKQVAASHQALIEHFRVQDERVDSHDKWRNVSEEKLTAPINSQVKFEVRQERLEEAFSQVAESQLMVVQLAGVHGERLDGHDKAMDQAESRFTSLIEAQIQLTHCVHALTTNISTLGAHLDQAVQQIKALATAQTRTDEQIRQWIDNSTKPARKSTRTAKKGRPGAEQRDSTGYENNPLGEPGVERGGTG
ncbi:MAG TPA: hypothetical protein VJ810_39025 [Blastocatellia bacterium]|nr:hypothetical protein [Blastocatellia bacterium]